MTEHVSEQQLALYAWGDLPPLELRVVDQHLGECEDCLRALADFRVVEDLVSSSLQDPAPETLNEVRGGVLAELTTLREPQRRWPWWMAGTAAAALALALLPPVRVGKLPAVPASARAVTFLPKQSETVIIRPVRERPRPRHRHREEVGVRSFTLIAQADRPAVFKMTTGDPDVVILWQTEEKKERQP